MFQILAMEVSRNWLMAAGLGVLAAVALVAFTRKRAEHHKKAQEAAGVLREHHLLIIAAICDAYSIDDYRGVVTAFKHLVDTLKDPAQRDLAFARFVAFLMEAKFRDPATRDAAIKWIDDLKALTAPGGRTAANLETSVRDLLAVLKTHPQLALDPKLDPAPPAA